MIVVNLYGGPCSGKSTLMAGLFYALKSCGKNVEMSAEFVKDSVYDGNPYPFQDQIYVFANMLKHLRQYDGKVDYVITDAPLLMNSIYGEKELPAFHKLVMEEYNQYNNINYLLERSKNVDFVSSGRVNTEKESNDIHNKVKKLLDRNNIPYKTYSISKPKLIDTLVTDILNNKEDKIDFYCFPDKTSEKLWKNLSKYFVNPKAKKKDFLENGFSNYHKPSLYFSHRLTEPKMIPCKSFSIIVNAKTLKISDYNILDEEVLQPTNVNKEDCRKILEYMDEFVKKGLFLKK